MNLRSRPVFLVQLEVFILKGLDRLTDKFSELLSLGLAGLLLSQITAVGTNSLHADVVLKVLLKLDSDELIETFLVCGGVVGECLDHVLAKLLNDFKMVGVGIPVHLLFGRGKGRRRLGHLKGWCSGYIN